jgi:hypothetical protein
MPNLPTILLAFANDQDAHLDMLKNESHEVYKAIETIKRDEIISIEREESATLEIIADRLITYREDICIFHYSGHASGQHLGLENGQVNSQGIAELIAALPNLQLVVLNGCATYGQVELLFELGVKAVVATQVAIGDTKAMEFSMKFYQALGKQQTIEEAYHTATNFLKAKYNQFQSNKKDVKGLKLKRDKESEKVEWCLYWKDENTINFKLDYHLRHYHHTQYLTDNVKRDISEFRSSTTSKYLKPLENFEWQPYEFELPNNTTMVVLPLAPKNNMVYCIAKYPTTNQQYRIFLNSISDYPDLINLTKGYISLFETLIKHSISSIIKHFKLKKQYYNTIKFNFKEPKGKIFTSKKWKKYFYPFRDKNFNDDKKPVVCVSFYEAIFYSIWLNNKVKKHYKNSLVFIPTRDLWHFAAFGRKYTTTNSDDWMKQVQTVHHLDNCTASINNSENRQNFLGVVDLFGNVWEWSIFYPIMKNIIHNIQAHTIQIRTVSFIPRFRPNIKHIFRLKDKIPLGNLSTYIQGGSFYDDLSRKNIPLQINSRLIENGTNTRHSDLGFRVACMIDINILPKEIKSKLLRISVDKPNYIKNHLENLKNYYSIPVEERKVLSFKRKIIEGLGNSNIENILKQLLNYSLLSDELLEEITLIKNQYNRVKKDFRLGHISYSQKFSEENRITAAIVEILNEI